MGRAASARCGRPRAAPGRTRRWPRTARRRRPAPPRSRSPPGRRPAGAGAAAPPRAAGRPAPPAAPPDRQTGPARYRRSSCCSAKSRYTSMASRRCAVDAETPSRSAASVTRIGPSCCSRAASSRAASTEAIAYGGLFFISRKPYPRPAENGHGRETDDPPVEEDVGRAMSTSPVSITAGDGPGQPERTPELEELYRGFEKELLVPLWTEIGDLMPHAPQSKALPHVLALGRPAAAGRAGRRAGAGRSRRASAGPSRWPTPASTGRPFAAPTLWAAIQYLNPREDAPVHRHTQNAFRFVVEGEGVWTVVNGDPVAMRRGDFLPQAGWDWHGHHNASSTPMAWIDGLDIPFQHYADSTFFEFGPDAGRGHQRARSAPAPSGCGATPDCARSPTSSPPRPRPLLAYRWEHTDRALRRAAGAGGRGPRRHGRARARRRPLHEPDHRRRRAADAAHRVPPAGRRHRDRRPPRGRLLGVPGVRGHRRGHRGRRDAGRSSTATCSSSPPGSS